MRDAPYLTKSSYVRGTTCQRLLWLSWHQRLPFQEPAAGSPAAVGIAIGERAHSLFPGGVLVDEAPWQHDAAVVRTRTLMADPDVPAIFEAAFEHEGVRIRVDVMERLDAGGWGLREVKSATKVKANYVDDAAVQAFVLLQSGIEVSSIELVHVNTDYIFERGEIDWAGFFKRRDIGLQVQAELADMAERLRAYLQVLDQDTEPNIEPGPHCPSGCDYWEHCTRAKPADWIFKLPRLSQKKYDALIAMQVESIADIPPAFELTDSQDRMRDVIVSGRPYVSKDLARALAPLEGPVSYLDFEAMNPAIPIHAGTKPYQRLVFQWSLHRDDGSGRLIHADYLGDHRYDPREPFIVSLVEALEPTSEPIVVYSAYERGVLKELAEQFPAYAGDLEKIIERLADLYVVVRDHVYLDGFNGSLSIKQVGKVLAPGFSYGDLQHVADGAQAAAAYQQLAYGMATDVEAAELRQALLAYCRLDTLAMVEAHRGLRALARSPAI